jgi:hypothetical protein
LKEIIDLAVRRRKRKYDDDSEYRIPPACVPQWMLGMPLNEWLLRRVLPQGEAEAMLQKIQTRLEALNNGSQ